jgi:hypothetical protein
LDDVVEKSARFAENKILAKVLVNFLMIELSYAECDKNWVEHINADWIHKKQGQNKFLEVQR